MSLTSPKAIIPARLLAAAGGACALIGLTVAAPQAKAATEPAPRGPIECQFAAHATASPITGDPLGVSFATSGPITCSDPSTGQQVMQGTETLVETISRSGCNGPDSAATATLAVNWSDGTASKAVLNSFQGRTLGGTLVSNLYGTNDPDSTSLPDHGVAVTALILGVCGGADSADVDATVAYVPPQP